MPMRDFEYDYTVWPDNDSDRFDMVCEQIRKQMPDYDDIGKFVLADFNLGLFINGEKEIRVYDDYFAGSIYVKSDVPLDIFS